MNSYDEMFTVPFCSQLEFSFNLHELRCSMGFLRRLLCLMVTAENEGNPLLECLNMKAELKVLGTEWTVLLSEESQSNTIPQHWFLNLIISSMTLIRTYQSFRSV